MWARGVRPSPTFHTIGSAGQSFVHLTARQFHGFLCGQLAHNRLGDGVGQIFLHFFPANQRGFELCDGFILCKRCYDAACTFHGTRYDSIEECEAAQKRFETEKGNIDALAPVIDSEIDKLVLKYTPKSRDAAKEVHNALERRYAGLARTPKMLALKQFLFTYAQCEKDVEAANKSKATPLKRNIAAALCAAMIVLNVLNPFTAVVRWIVAIACGGFLWWQMDGLTDQKVGARARTVLDSGAVFHPRDTLVYTGTQNYSLTHEDKAPDAEIQKERRTEILEGLGAIVLIGAVCPLIAELL